MSRLDAITEALSDSKIWNDKDSVEKLGKEQSLLEKTIRNLDGIEKKLNELSDFLELIKEDNDLDIMDEIRREIYDLGKELTHLEFRRMFSLEADHCNAFVDIQAGSGGTEAQDWAEMLTRMYMKWAEKKGFKTEVLEMSEGDVAGLKSAAIKLSGDYAFGWARTETGVHRLVRKSPFDSGSRRHTSFASVFVSPEIDDKIEVEINQADIRLDTYRASGAGGQHVNKTDSAVRLTHIPTATVVQCQSQRSQHKNKDQAMKLLQAKLYEIEMLKRKEAMKQVEESKADIGWGSQIRSYVLDQSRIKDIRTGVETGNVAAVLDGSLDLFIEASLKQGV